MQGSGEASGPFRRLPGERVKLLTVWLGDMAMEEKRYESATRLYEKALTQHDSYMARCASQPSLVFSSSPSSPIIIASHLVCSSSFSPFLYPSSSSSRSQGCHRAWSDVRTGVGSGGGRAASSELLPACSPSGRGGRGNRACKRDGMTGGRWLRWLRRR